MDDQAGPSGAGAGCHDRADQVPADVKAFARSLLRHLHVQVAGGTTLPGVIQWGPNPFIVAAAQGRDPQLGDFVAYPFGYLVLDLQRMFKRQLDAGPLGGGLPCIHPECRPYLPGQELESESRASAYG
jgi:hypothetical protein